MLAVAPGIGIVRDGGENGRPPSVVCVRNLPVGPRARAPPGFDAIRVSAKRIDGSRGRADDDFIVSEGVKTDGSGRFTIAALGGREYRLFAERLRPGDRAHRIDSTDPLVLSAIEGLKPVRLTLQRRY